MSEIVTTETFPMTPAQNRVQSLIQWMRTQNPVDNMPLKHRFTPGMYIREIFMPKGSLVVSRIHKTEHPFVCTSGHAAVWTEKEGVKQIKAGHIGITTPGTLRVLYMHDDTVWVTFHAGNWTPETDPQTIVEEVTSIPESNEIDESVLKELTHE